MSWSNVPDFMPPFGFRKKRNMQTIETLSYCYPIKHVYWMHLHDIFLSATLRLPAITRAQNCCFSLAGKIVHCDEWLLPWNVSYNVCPILLFCPHTIYKRAEFHRRLYHCNDHIAMAIPLSHDQNLSIVRKNKAICFFYGVSVYRPLYRCR